MYFLLEKIKINYIYRGSHISLGWFSCRSSILVELEFGVLVFVKGGKPESPEKNLGARMRTNNKLNPHKMPGPRVRWEASAL